MACMIVTDTLGEARGADPRFQSHRAARAQRDPKFRQALFTEAISGYLAGDTRTGKAVLRDLVNALRR